MVFPHPLFNPAEALKAIHAEKTTVWFGTPTMYMGTDFIWAFTTIYIRVQTHEFYKKNFL